MDLPGVVYGNESGSDKQGISRPYFPFPHEKWPRLLVNIVGPLPSRTTLLSPVKERVQLRPRVTPAPLPLVVVIADWHRSCTGTTMPLSPFSLESVIDRGDAVGYFLPAFCPYLRAAATKNEGE